MIRYHWKEYAVIVENVNCFELIIPTVFDRSQILLGFPNNLENLHVPVSLVWHPSGPQHTLWEP